MQVCMNSYLPWCRVYESSRLDGLYEITLDGQTTSLGTQDIHMGICSLSHRGQEDYHALGCPKESEQIQQRKPEKGCHGADVAAA